MTTGPRPRTGDDHDPWLAAALRHAPDAADAPPAGLSEAILRAAHDTAATARAPSRERSPAGVLQNVWSWLAQPAVATTFATLVLATAIGVMWWGETVEPELTRPTTPPPGAVTSAAPAPTAAATEPTTAAQPAPPQAAPTATPPAMPPVAQGDDAAKQTARAPVFRSRSGPEAGAGAVKSEGRAAIAVDRAAPSTVVPPGEQAASLDEARESGRAARQHAAPAPSAMPGVATQAPISRPRQPAEAAAPAPDEVPGRAPIDARIDAAPQGARSAPAAAASLPARRAEPAAAPSEPAAAIAEPTALFADVRNRPQRWRWQADGGAPRAVDASFLHWWAQLERAAPAWSAQAPGASSAAAAPALVLRAIDDASDAVTIRIEADSARARFAGGAAWRASLGRADAAALREAIEGLSR